MVSIGGTAMKRILVTGASGFVGQALVPALLEQGYLVRAAVRSIGSTPSAEGLDVFVVGEVGARTDWSSALVDVDFVVHCAARAHVMKETESDALAAYRSVNVDGLRRLAEQAASAGVRRLVYLSSIKVNGQQTVAGAPFLLSDTPAPEDPYDISKWEAEQALWAVTANKCLEVVVVRPPLVYGKGAKGNLGRLLKLMRLGVPLPLGAVQNQRSLIGLDNLVDLLIRCVYHPAAAAQTLLVSDSEDVSTPDLLRHMAAGLGRSARLLPVPVSVLRLTGRALGKQSEIDRLVGSLQIDSHSACELLDWTPPVSLAEGIQRMVKG